METQNTIRDTQDQLPRRHCNKLPSISTTDDRKDSEGDGYDETEDRESDVDPFVMIPFPRPPGTSLI